MESEKILRIENPQYFYDLYEAFKKAKDRIECVNKICKSDGVLETPSLNELRYVGFHLIKAFSDINSENGQEEILRAKRHCERASYDILEIGVIYQLALFKKFKDEFKKTRISSVVKDWLDICEKIEKINAELVEHNRYDEGGEEYHKLAERKLLELNGIIKKFPYYRAELRKVRKRELINNVVIYSGWIIAALTVIVMIIEYFLS
ncbi:MAG: hypothetical protein HGB12_14035 [Bacteroidetes bacterium]|nr:hypothetical protein [Bacteroidota bacterium]